MTQPAGGYTYCRSKARYLSSIFRKISPYKLMRNPVIALPPLISFLSSSNFQKFRTHNIDGSALLKLTEAHLVDVLKFSLGPSVKLINAVADKIRYRTS